MITKMKLCAMASVVLMLSNCTSDDLETNDSISKTDQFTDVVESSTDVAYRISSLNSVYFTENNQSINTLAKAETIFNNDMSGWNNNIASISDNKLKIALQEKYGTSGAMTSLINISDGAKYQLTFDVKFEKDFAWSKGGKVGFGFYVGEGVTGGRNTEATIDNKGGSFRVMWRKASGGKPYFIPYVYYKEMTGKYGDDFDDKQYKDIVSNKWYRIRLTLHVNTKPTTNDGYAKMEVSPDFGDTYTKVWENNTMRWSGASESNLVVKKINFAVFRGGGDSSWNGSKGTQDIYFDNVKWEKL